MASIAVRMVSRGGIMCSQPRRKNAVSCQDSFYASHDFFYRLGVGRRNDLETTITFRAAPKIDEVTFIPMLTTFGKKNSSLLHWTHVIANLQRRSDAIVIMMPSVIE